MTSSAFRTRPPVSTASGQLSLPTRQFRPGFAALGLFLILGLAFSGAWLYQQAGAKVDVVQVVRQVAVGQPLTRDDLSTVAVAGDLTAVGAGNLESVLGQTAAVTLLPGTLLQREMISDGSTGLTADQSQVGVAVSGAQMPADGLVPGDTVEVYRLADGSGEGSTQLLVQAATVTAANPDPQSNGGSLLTLTVPRNVGGAVASASGAGQIAVVRIKAPS
ncbi:hypothetical protein LWF15_11125 [Kineosporia rhizophila]|uniref:SAF domain-containing protein n=1 Tax=Kineosporia rhizophila TaxID=84633 RepID=UPI000AFDA1C4|nr:SAF domain-containing protein [Kineosporia rhizophila]MCE0536062.1 hypothetical protein [Kineosporia rhizophila]